MSDDVERIQLQLDRMTVEQIKLCVQQNQDEMSMVLEQLFIRAYVQTYTEKQYDGLLVLYQEAVSFIEEIPMLPEWAERRDELLDRMRKQL